jgi:hypothetical protein
VAFHYSSVVEHACTCGSKSLPESENALMGDPTLRKGDLVMTADGIRMFRGASRSPYGLTILSASPKPRCPPTNVTH